MEIVDVYLSATLASLDRAIAEVALSEVKVTDRRRAARVIERLLETLVGLAIGSAVGSVITGVRHTTGAHVGARIPMLGPPARMRGWIDDDGPARRPAAELKLRLRGRVARAGRDVRVLLVEIEREREIAAEDRPAFARMLGLMAGDELTAERFAQQVRAGWRCAAAAIEGRAVPTVEPLWQRWAMRVIGGRAELDYEVILRIA